MGELGNLFSIIFKGTVSILVIGFAISFAYMCYESKKLKQQEEEYQKQKEKENERINLIIQDSKPKLQVVARTEYPATLDEYIGHSDVVKQLKIMISNYKKYGRVPEHILLTASGGLGKSTLSEIIANEVGKGYISTVGEELQSTNDLQIILDSLDEGVVFHLDEAHGAELGVKEYLYSILQDFKLNKPGEPIIYFPKFTFIASTTNPEKLPDPLITRMTYKLRLEKYTEKEIQIILPNCLDEDIEKISDKARVMISKVAQGNIRVARNELLKGCTDLALYNNKQIIDEEVVREIIQMKGIDEETGMNKTQIQILSSLADGRTIGLKNLAFMSGVGVKELEDIFEPGLILNSFILRTSRGRVITNKGLNLLERIK